MHPEYKNGGNSPKPVSTMKQFKVKNAYVSGPVALKHIVSVRKLLSDKRGNGYVLVIGGGEDYHGAPVIAGRAAYSTIAALRAGAGYAKVAVPSSVLNPVRSLTPDIIAFADGKNSLSFNKRIADEIMKADSVCLGIGAGSSHSAISSVSKMIRICIKNSKRTVLDADGLRALHRNTDMQRLGGNFVITPNSREFGALFGSVPDEKMLVDRIGAARRLAAETGAVVVLKGHTTIITDGNATTINRARDSALAVMGTGDALSGIIAGLAPNSADMYEAAVAGVYIHSEIGSMLYKSMGAHILASDIVKEMPIFFRRFGR